MPVVISVKGGTASESYREDQAIPYTITLSAPSSEVVSLSYGTTRSGTASSYSDFDERYGTIVFQPGETTKTIYVSANDDNSTPEADESVEVEFSNAVNATFSSGSRWESAIGWILDDDGTDQKRALAISNPIIIEGNSGQTYATFVVSISRPLDVDTSFSYTTRNGTALAGQDFTATAGNLLFLAGQTTAIIKVPVINDTVVETGEMFDLVINTGSSFSHAGFGNVSTASIIDNDGLDSLPTISIESYDDSEYYRGDENPYYKLRLSEASGESITVSYRVKSGTATLGTDTANYYDSYSVTFAPGERTKYINIRSNDDSDIELDECVIVELFNPINATLQGGGMTTQSVAWIYDDDGYNQTRAVYVTSPTVREGEVGGKATAVFSIDLSRPSAERLTFSYETVDGSAAAGQDYVARRGTVTFEPGQTHLEVRVAVNADYSTESAETFSLRLLTPFPSYVGSSAANTFATATVLDGSILGTSGADVLRGTSFADAIFGYGGRDWLLGYGGNDALYGGDAGDFLDGGTGNDYIVGGSGIDKVYFFTSTM